MSKQIHGGCRRSLGQQEFSKQELSKHGFTPVTQERILSLWSYQKMVPLSRALEGSGVTAPSASHHRDEQGSAKPLRFYALAQTKAVDAKGKSFPC